MNFFCFLPRFFLLSTMLYLDMSMPACPCHIPTPLGSALGEALMLYGDGQHSLSMIKDLFWVVKEISLRCINLGSCLRREKSPLMFEWNDAS